MATDPYASPVAQTATADPVPGGSDPTQWWNVNPTAGFWEYLRQHGLIGDDPTSKYAQGRFNQINAQFTADAAKDPTMGFFDYLNGKTGQNFDLANEYASQSPDQRGDFGSRTYSARGRWITPR